MERKKALFNWSGGKDSAMALWHVLKDPEWEICGLLSTFNSSVNRLSMHGVRKELIRKQAERIGLPLFELDFPEQLTMETYDLQMRSKLQELTDEHGFEYSVFGDINLEDLRRYREEKLALLNLKGVFPLWGKDTSALARTFVDEGFKATVVCVSSPALSEDFAGRTFDHSFLSDLPDSVDPCGENGEFHTFVYDGPVFSEPVEIETGDKVFKPQKTPYKTNGEASVEVCQPNENEGFWYVDLMQERLETEA